MSPRHQPPAALTRGFLLILLVLPVWLSAAGDELFDNADFSQGAEGWKRYANDSNAEAEPPFELTFEDGRAVITGERCEPQARVGFRSLETSLGGAISGSVFRLEIDWAGRGIHRAGAMILMLDKNGKILRSADLIGPGGDFEETVRGWIGIHGQEWTLDPRVIVYVYQDGAGELTVSRVSLRQAAIDAGEFDVYPPPPDRDVFPVQQSIRVDAPVYLEAPFVPSAARGPLLAGESRLFVKPPDGFDGDAVTHLRLKDRRVALAWEYGVEAKTPFWVAEGNASWRDFVRVEGTEKAVALPPLPADRAAYLYFYGDYRYGKTEDDLERDRRVMRLIREAGFTGLVVHDDYGLQFEKWNFGGEMEDAYLIQMARLYKEAGFPSPMVYRLMAGMEKGDVKWPPSEKSGADYLATVGASLARAREILGPDMLMVTPIDEPNKPERRDLAAATIPQWSEAFGVPLVITCTWQTAGILKGAGVRRWVGAGDYPAFPAARERGIDGFYCSVLGRVPPVNYRYLAGVHAWASGLRSQGYWHAWGRSGEVEYDLDGKQPDYLCVDADGRATAHFAALREGLMDSRLLLALEAASGPESTHPRAAEARAFLLDLRQSITTTDRRNAPWIDPEHFEEVRGKAAGMLAELAGE